VEKPVAASHAASQRLCRHVRGLGEITFGIVFDGVDSDLRLPQTKHHCHREPPAAALHRTQIAHCGSLHLAAPSVGLTKAEES
jgi:hypothetical protein